MTITYMGVEMMVELNEFDNIESITIGHWDCTDLLEHLHREIEAQYWEEVRG